MNYNMHTNDQNLQLQNITPKGYNFKHDDPFDKYNQYVDYLFKKGLGGQGKYVFTTNYIRISSENQKLQSNNLLTKTLHLINDNPFSYVGTTLRIKFDKQNDINVNDQILIYGIPEKNIILRTKIGNTNSIEFANGFPYLTFHTFGNITPTNAMPYADRMKYKSMTISLSGFTGDTSTQWTFNFSNYIVSKTQSLSNYDIRIEENVYAVDPTSNPINMLISTCTVDQYGKVIGIDLNAMLYQTTNSLLRWKDPANPLASLQSIPNDYFTDGINLLTSASLLPVPLTPMTFYDYVYYVERCQNILRPLFFTKMTSPPTTNFSLQYSNANKTYQQNVTITMPQNTVISTTGTIGNIQTSFLNQSHRMYLTSDDIMHELNNNYVVTQYPTDTEFYVNLTVPYKPNQFNYNFQIGQSFLSYSVYDPTISDVSITFHHIGGIQISELNSVNANDMKVISSIENNYIEILPKLKQNGLYTENFGGKLATIEIITTNEYQGESSLYLSKCYTNVVMIRMIDSLFHKTHNSFDSKIVNGELCGNTGLYWENMDDGNYVYSIFIPNGNYTQDELKNQIEKMSQQIFRFNGTIITSKKNKLTCDFNSITNSVSITNTSYYYPIISPFIKNVTLNDINNPLLPAYNDIENNYYKFPQGDFYKQHQNLSEFSQGYVLKIYHPTHKLIVGQIITISGSLNVNVIPSEYINGVHEIMRIIDENNYDIFIPRVNIGPISQITGGTCVTISYPIKFRLRMDYNNTLGKELGFRNVGESTSITPFNYTILNTDKYENELQQMSNEEIKSLGFNLDNYTQLFILCDGLNKISNAFGNEPEIKEYFYKINMKYDACYSTFTDAPLYFSNPININNLLFNYVTKNGVQYDFKGKPHHFVLEIMTLNEVPDGTTIGAKT